MSDRGEKDAPGDAGRAVWLAGLGALAELETGGRRLFDELVERGRKVERRQLKSIDRAVSAASEGAERLGDAVRERFRGGVAEVLHRANLPSRDDLKLLASHLDRLAERIDGLAGER